MVALADKDGKAFATYRYDAWGNPIESTTATTTSIPTISAVANIAARQVLRYAGYCWDAESKMYYCSARTYDPATRQFTSKDPAKADGEESAYQYCGGDPVGSVDPSGLHRSKLCGSHWHIPPTFMFFISSRAIKKEWKTINGRLHYRWATYRWYGYQEYFVAFAIYYALKDKSDLIQLGSTGATVAVGRISGWQNDRWGFKAARFRTAKSSWVLYR